jgi:hypothetical protein
MSKWHALGFFMKLFNVVVVVKIRLHGFIKTELYNIIRKSIVVVVVVVVVMWLETLQLIERTDGHDAICYYSKLTPKHLRKTKWLFVVSDMLLLMQ